MSIREKFFNAMRRIDGSYVPFEFGLCPSLHEEFKRRTDKEDYAEYYGFPVRFVSPVNKVDPGRFSKYHTNSDNLVRVTDWGVGHKQGSVAHFTEMQHPMKDLETIEEFQQYPYPDPVADYDWSEVAAKVNSIKERDLIVIAPMSCTIFETAWYMRGMDNLMIDMVMNHELADYHMDRIMNTRCEFARRYAEAGVDVLALGDDVSTQLDMMMSPEMWRGFLKHRLGKVIRAAKDIKPDILIFYHGDGNLQKIIPDLIEVGVDILNPIQPECMDPAEIKRLYGDRLSFWGTLGTQTTLPFGTAEDVRNECIKMIETVGKGGGLLLSPSHLLEPEVPWENIQAYIDTVNEYNNR